MSSWEYYRVSPDEKTFIGIWRKISESSYRLIHKTALPRVAVGSHRVDLDEPIQVLAGDFIGVHSQAITSPVTFCGAGKEDGWDDSLLGHTLQIPAFETDLHDKEGEIFHMPTPILSRQTIAVRAVFILNPPGQY